MKKKKGYVLILSLAVISLMLILASIVLAASTSAYINTKKVEQANKLKLIAESGVEKGRIILNNYILRHAETREFSYLDFNPNDINGEFGVLVDGKLVLGRDLSYMVGDTKCTISFSPNSTDATIPDLSTGRNIKYIQIQATAERTVGGETQSKTITAILDKASLSNVYFNQIFKSSLTTAEGKTNKDGTEVNSVNIEDGAKLDISGNIFFQGQNLNLFKNNPSSLFTFNEGKIVLNSNSINTKVDNLTDSKSLPIDLFKNKSGKITGLPNKNSWKNSIFEDLTVLGIKVPTVGNTSPDPILDFKDNISNLGNCIVFQQASTGVGVPLQPTLVTYKVKRTDPGPINFQTLIDGANPNDPEHSLGLYSTILDELKNREKASYRKLHPAPEPEMTDAAASELAKAEYKTFYKLILVDGDLEINDLFTEKFINYLIYCTGKVTFKGENNFYNSSVFAKQIEFKANDNGQYGNGVKFYGVGTQKAINYENPSNLLAEFSSTDKMIINQYLIRNLDGYSDHIVYKIIQWK